MILSKLNHIDPRYLIFKVHFHHYIVNYVYQFKSQLIYLRFFMIHLFFYQLHLEIIADKLYFANHVLPYKFAWVPLFSNKKVKIKTDILRVCIGTYIGIVITVTLNKIKMDI